MLTQPEQTLCFRPGTLAEALRFRGNRADQSRSALVGFLDAFYLDRDRQSRRARVLDEPPLIDDPRTDALFGAIGEHLCSRWRLGAAPEWTKSSRRFLREPYFMGPERMKPFLLAESPSAFRRRFIFTEAEPLRRATMPRDGRWWYYETIRTGMTPVDGEEIESA